MVVRERTVGWNSEKYPVIDSKKSLEEFFRYMNPDWNRRSSPIALDIAPESGHNVSSIAVLHVPVL